MNTENTLLQTREEEGGAYERSLVASQFVDWLVAEGEMVTREEAEQLGRRLLEHGIIQHGEDFCQLLSLLVLCQSSLMNFDLRIKGWRHCDTLTAGWPRCRPPLQCVHIKSDSNLLSLSRMPQVKSNKLQLASNPRYLTLNYTQMHEALVHRVATSDFCFFVCGFKPTRPLLGPSWIKPVLQPAQVPTRLGQTVQYQYPSLGTPDGPLSIDKCQYMMKYGVYFTLAAVLLHRDSGVSQLGSGCV